MVVTIACAIVWFWQCFEVAPAFRVEQLKVVALLEYLSIAQREQLPLRIATQMIF
jgi:hypothetical protein